MPAAATGVPAAGLAAVLADDEHGFAMLARGAPLPEGLVATFVEAEGVSVIAPVAVLAAAGLDHRPGWARIDFGAATALDGVGLTASVASALAERGISANIVAAYHHDHLFVPWTRREEAMAVLHQLTGSWE